MAAVGGWTHAQDRTSGPPPDRPPPASLGGASVQLEADSWRRVQQALTPEQQAAEVRGFLRLLAWSGGRPVSPAVDARDIASGRAAPLDDPTVLQRPQAHELTVTVDGRFYTFRPLSRASVEPLLAR